MLNNEEQAVFMKAIKEHYSGDVLSFYTYDEPEVILTRAAFEDTNSTHPVVMLGYIIKHKNVPVSFEVPATGNYIPAWFFYTHGIFMALHYELGGDGTYELVEVEGPKTMTDNGVDKVEFEREALTKEDIYLDYGDNISPEDYVDTMTFDLQNEVREASENAKVDKHLTNIVLY